MIRIVSRKKSEEAISEPCSVEELLKNLRLKEQNYICLRNGTPVTRFDSVSPEDEVVLMEIFSGG